MGEAFIGAQRRSFRLVTLATLEGCITASVERKSEIEGERVKEKRAEFEEEKVGCERRRELSLKRERKGC